MTQEEKAKRYDEALERAEKALEVFGTDKCEGARQIFSLFPELKESEDEKIRKHIISVLEDTWQTCKTIDYDSSKIQEDVAWLEKQGECVIDCPQNHQDSNRPSGGIVLEDFNGGEGFYKLNLAYLNKKQVEEVEEMVREWNNEPSTSEEDIKDCIGLCLTDADEQRFKNYHTNLRDCLAWLEKQKAIDVLDEEEREFADNVDSYRKEIDEAYQKGYNEGVKVTLEKQGEQKHTDKVEPKFKVGDWVVFNNKHQSIYQVEKIEDGYYILRHTHGGTFRVCVLHDESLRLWTIQDAKEGDVLVNGSNIFIFHFINDTRLMGYCHVNTDDGRFYYDIGKNECFCLIDAVVNLATKEQRDILFQKIKEAGYEWNTKKKELKIVDWSKHIKYEPNSPSIIEPKSNWSEEDDAYKLFIISAVEYYYDEKNPLRKDLIEWLESLRERCTWKPSDEQMVAIQEAINIVGVLTITGSKMNSLYQDLKKLKGKK